VPEKQGEKTELAKVKYNRENDHLSAITMQKINKTKSLKSDGSCGPQAPNFIHRTCSAQATGYPYSQSLAQTNLCRSITNSSPQQAAHSAGV